MIDRWMTLDGGDDFGGEQRLAKLPRLQPEAMQQQGADFLSDRPQHQRQRFAFAFQAVQHAHQPLPPDLQAYVDAVPDGAWPRPVLDYLAGKISQQALLGVAREFGPVKREMALNEAWFAIGSNLRAQGKAAEAIGALNYVADHGLRGFESTLLARSELALLTGTAAAAK